MHSELGETAVCTSCTNAATDKLDIILKEKSDEVKEKEEFIKKLQAVHEREYYQTNHVNLLDLEKELSDLDELHGKLLFEIEETKMQEEEIAEEIKTEQRCRVELRKKENDLFRDRCRFSALCTTSIDQQESYDQANANITYRLKKLCSTNILTATFTIKCTEHNGLINDACFGVQGNMTIDWTETNKAWGQATLFLRAVAELLNIEFSKYKIIPFANKSYLAYKQSTYAEPRYNRERSPSTPAIATTSESAYSMWKSLPLASEEDYLPSGLLLYTESFDNNEEYDAGIAAFVYCMEELQFNIQQIDHKFMYPNTLYNACIQYEEIRYSLRYIVLKY